MNNQQNISAKIKALETNAEVESCARMMAASEPWITLGRGFQASVETLSVPSKEVYLAIMGDEVAGFIIINMQGAFIGYIQTVCVDSAWRGKGIGSQLLAFAEERIYRDSPNVFICVSSFNPGARRLYQRLGYEVIGTLNDYIVAGHDELLLRKTIAPLNEFKK
jgi:ribosomal protein S18 acetylase RimI-like enzyme